MDDGVRIEPSGTVTFLFTGIEGSTKRWEKHPEIMRAALARHDSLLRKAIEAREGYVFKTISAAFAHPNNALQAAIAAQHALAAEGWPPEIGSLEVRMTLHTWVADTREGDYAGQPINRLASILATGHGGQVLLSEVVQSLVQDTLPEAFN